MVKSWDVSEHDFPRTGSLTEKLEFCLKYAILAHSTYNNQPWYFVVEDDTVSVYADRRYALPVVDPDDRQLIMSCASALFNLRVAIRHFGYQEYTQLLPNPADEDLIARVQISDAGTSASDQDTDLFKAITTRHINRSAFKKADVPKEQLDLLKDAARAEGAWLYVCEGDERDVVSHFVAEGDQIQMSKKAFRRELAAWNNPRRVVSRDGYPDYARSLKDMMQSTKPRILRRFETAPGQVVQDDEIAEGCPAIAILGSEKGGKVDRIYAGQAFMRVLLQAEALGLSVSTMNQPCEVPELRLRLHDELSDNHSRAQFILRIGYGEPVVDFNPRRSLESFIETASDQYRMSKVSNDDQNSGKTGIFGIFGNLFGSK